MHGILLAFQVTGKLGIGNTNVPAPLRGVWQRYHTRKGVISKKVADYTFVPGSSPQTIAARAKFAAAMAAWGALTSDQKKEYNARARQRHMFGWNLYIREYYQTNP